jgi:hypothetical protein
MKILKRVRAKGHFIKLVIFAKRFAGMTKKQGLVPEQVPFGSGRTFSKLVPVSCGLP